MLSKRAIAAVVGCAVVGTAFAGNSKVKDLVPVGPGLAENPAGDGQVKFKYVSATDETKIHVHIHDFQPNTCYGVKLCSNGIVVDNFPLALTTNPGGSGTYETTVPFDMTANTDVTIYMWDGNLDFNTFDVVTSTEIRATGIGESD